MKNDQPVNNKVIAVSESNRQLSLPSEIVSRGIDLAARIESQRGIKKYQRPIRYFPGIHAPSCIDFSRNGRFAAITSYAGYDNADPDLLIWDVAYAKITIFSLREGGHNYGGYFFSVALSDSGDLAAVGYDDGGILCWDVRENILRDFRGKTYNTYGDAAVCTVFSPDEQQFAINIGYGARLYDSGSGEFIGDFRPHKTDANYYNQMVFSNDSYWKWSVQ
jgi:WD40 repeat protein